MKAFLAFALVGAVIAFYLGYGPNDLIALWPSGAGGSTPPPKVRHSAPAADRTQIEAPAAAPARSSAVANSPDGSLEHRWTSPTKP
jgi:hypothetical protein